MKNDAMADRLDSCISFIENKFLESERITQTILLTKLEALVQRFIREEDHKTEALFNPEIAKQTRVNADLSLQALAKSLELTKRLEIQSMISQISKYERGLKIPRNPPTGKYTNLYLK